MADILDRAGAFVRALTGWRRFLFAFVAGLLSALSFAPFGLWPLLLLGFGALALLIDGAVTHAKPVRSAAFAGWAFGFGQFLAGLYWVGYAFLVDRADHLWQLPFIALILPGGLALFIALASAVSAYAWRPGWQRIFLFTAAYAAAEWVRGNIFTGFPWNLPGYGWDASLAILQSVSVVGVYGLSFLTILFGASLALLFAPARAKIWPVPAMLTLLFCLIWTGGALRLNTVPPNVPGVRLRLVQPNVPQQDKFIPSLRAQHWRELMDLSLAKNGPEPTHIIWPESAPPFLLAREAQALDDVAILTGTHRVLMTGAARVEVTPGKEPTFFNSFYIFAHGGQLIATYDKFHLVPFGEYVPSFLQTLGLSNVVNIPGSFGFGTGPKTFDVPGAPPVGPLICYEILFPGEVTARDRPQWFVNVTDDSWFGPPSSSGPYQHLLIARVRGIEEGLPIARAANTGISAVIDPMGRIVAQLGSGKVGVVDSALPAALPETFFAKFGETGFLLMLIFAGAAGLFWPTATSGRQAR
ncbi:MAG: apolipoprotein N-acyltransferase [Proteobacteria bacterium]|nr:apolipoprotein N-acyltransferase [Pseudomonadota bacterium]